MKTRILALIGLLSLGVQAQYSLTKDDFKNIRVTNGAPSSNSTARDSEFSEKFNKALSDVKRKEQAAQAESARAHMQNQDIINGNAHMPHRSATNASKNRAEIQFDNRGTTACRKTESGQTHCETQSRW
jgi:flagellar hook-basal body complex protein FliE